MSRLTTWGMGLLVLVLGGAIILQTRSEDPDFGHAEFPLFAGLEVNRVTGIRIDNVERNTHIGIEQDARGRWLVVDPIAYPARTELLTALFRVCANRAWPVPPEELEQARVSLDEPRAVLEFTEQLADGSQTKHRVTMGAVDIDGMRVFVEVNGRTLRTLRNLEGILENDLHEWRSRRVFEVDGSKVVAVERTGFDYSGEQQVDLDLSVVRESTNWLVQRPVRVHADPGAVTTWTQVLARLGVTQFVSDRSPANLEPYGLESPWFELSLEDHTGLRQTLQFANRQGDYFCKRTDLPNVWRIEGRDVEAIFFDVRKLFDESITRVYRREVSSLLLLGDDPLRLRRTTSGSSWSLAQLTESGQWGLESAAEGSAVEALLSVLEQERVHNYLWDEPVANWFAEDKNQRRGVFVEVGGVRSGGWVGARVPSESGVPQYAFLREGESVVGLVGEPLHEMISTPRTQLLSLYVYTLDEIRLKRIRVIGLPAGSGRQQDFVRSVQGTWVYPDKDPQVQVEARELRGVLDHLTHLLASRHLSAEEGQDLSQKVAVEILAQDGSLTRVEVGLTESGEVRALYEGQQSPLAHPGLHQDLLDLLD